MFATIQKHWRLAALAASCTIGIAAGVLETGVGVERAIRQSIWGLRQHAASGDLHIVEIDARSIAAIDRWPWPRSHHARIVDRLRNAGAASIVFDVDLSSRSTAREDAALAAALARTPGKVVLPTFSQQAGSGQGYWTDSIPIPALRDHAALAVVSIRPDSDGYVRRAPIGSTTSGVARPSLSALTAGISGVAEADFPIDFGIDPASIPRHSFIDIERGKFDPAALRGKQVLIGATAVEMGDRYAVPNYGVIPGVVIQAMAAETLAKGIPREGGWQVPLFLALCLAWTILAARSRGGLLIAAALAPPILFVVAVLADVAFRWTFPLVPGLAVLGSATFVASAVRWLAAARRRRLHDPATGLPNRLALSDALRTSGGVGVAAARIAEFDKLSAALGETATADLVRRVCDRISLIADEAIVYRVEDRVLAWRCFEHELLDSRFATLRTAMLAPIDVAGRRVDVSLAFGLALEDASEDADRVVANAAFAADQALASGEAWHVHQTDEDETVNRELSLLSELDEAVGKGEIQVVYQPKLNLGADRITSVEALVRWHHGTRGFLGPDLFIPLAERNGRIAGLTLHVLEQTILDLRRWQLLGHDITGAVNISAKLLTSTAFIESVRELVRASGLEATRLTFEVTESAAMNDQTGAIAALHSFRDLGISISMDDYGTGQSTLSYIKQLPLDELKIDRSFVQFCHRNRGDGVLVRSTIDLAHELGLKVVAEGVEDADCLEFLKQAGCDLVQGYFVSRPVPADQLAKLLCDYREAA